MKLSQLWSYLSKIDIFGQTITLNMNRNETYTTSIGGFASILIICLLSIIFFSNITDFFARTTVYYDGEITFSNDPELIQMNDQNSMVAFSIDQTNFTTSPYFNISIEQRTYTRYANGTQIKTTQIISLVPCSIDRFNNIFLKQGINFTDQFNSLGMKTWLCPPVNYTFELQGTYSSDIFKFMKIVVSNCTNSTTQRDWNPTCSSESDKLKYLNSNGEFKLQVYQINTVINPQKSNDYKTVFLDSDMYFTFVPYKLARLANVYYRSNIINNDESLLPYQDIEQENIIQRKAEDFRDLTELGRDTDSTYAAVYLRRSPFTEITNRRFQKLSELLSYLGGFMQIMRAVFGFFIAFYNRTSMLIELSNKLYEFRELDKVFSSQKTITSNVKVIDSQIKASGILQKIEWKDYVSQLVTKSKPIILNFKLLINQLTFGQLLKDKNSIFLNKAMRKINTELDLHSILYQLHEISRLKQILLRRSQITLFNFTPKPVITLQKETVEISRFDVEDEDRQELTKKSLYPNEEVFVKLQDAYKEISEEMEQNQENLCQMNLNLKLINLIGSDIKNLLKQNSCLTSNNGNENSPNEFPMNTNHEEIRIDYINK